jgi:hypothetical protein
MIFEREWDATLRGVTDLTAEGWHGNSKYGQAD